MQIYTRITEKKSNQNNLITNALILRNFFTIKFNEFWRSRFNKIEINIKVILTCKEEYFIEILN